jgi:hypothetical protein
MLTITTLAPVEYREHTREPDRGPLWIEDGYGKVERLTRRWDRGSQALGMVIAVGIALVVGIGLGIVHGRANPLPPVPVAVVRQ